MKSTGTVRKLDRLGRIVIPKQIRKERGLEAGVEFEIEVDNDMILVSKYIPKCIFCGQPSEECITFKQRYICKECVNKLKELKK